MKKTWSRMCSDDVLEEMVMATPIISILFESSEESMGSHAPRVILFGVIPAIIPVIPEVLIVPADPIITPEEGTVSVVSPTEVLDLVDYSSSSDSNPLEDSLPPVPEFLLVSPFLCSNDSEADGESEPAVLAWRRISHHSSDRHSSPDSSSSSLPLDHSLSGHTPPDTTDANSSTPHRFVHRSLATTLHDSSLGSSSEGSLDSFSPSARPSRKRCSSPIASVPSPTHDSRLIAPYSCDLLPLASGFVIHTHQWIAEREIWRWILVVDAEDDVELRQEASAADLREKIVVFHWLLVIVSESSRGGIPDLKDTICDIVHYMSEVRIDRIIEIKTTQR
ncbi:hypothetical protein Tco_0679349 [Tanacetum coccineum]|uniref:Uncharacterized protein n=1 Tax=Tanacetum coccineum TaxID=301880 RepID=A0ABQ4XHL2_9ASTR